MPPLPNHLPTLPASAPYRLALLLPWPSEDDCRIGQPLTDSAGAWLKGTLSAVGILLDECAVCHVSQHWASTWEASRWDGEAIQSGIAALAADLATWRPNLVLGLDDPRLGAGVLHLLRHGNVAPHRTPSGYQWPSALGKWRGSLFETTISAFLAADSATPASDEVKVGQTVRGPCPPLAGGESAPSQPECCQQGRSDFGGVAKEAAPTMVRPSGVSEGYADVRVSNPASTPSFKCMTTYHPTYLHAVWSKAFDARQDIARARTEARSAALVLPTTRIAYGPVE